MYILGAFYSKKANFNINFVEQMGQQSYNKFIV